jgi:hypothetical protein
VVVSPFDAASPNASNVAHANTAALARHVADVFAEP